MISRNRKQKNSLIVKRFITILVTLSLLISIFPGISVNAASDKENVYVVTKKTLFHGSTGCTYSYSYNKNGLISKYNIVDEAKSSRTDTYSYKADKLEKRVSYMNNNKKNKNVFTYEYTDDQMSKMISKNKGLKKTFKFEYQYTYDDNDRLTTVETSSNTNTLSNVYKISYNKKNQIKKVITYAGDKKSSERVFEYDKKGHIKKDTTYLFSGGKHKVSETVYENSYNSNGFITKSVQSTNNGPKYIATYNYKKMSVSKNYKKCIEQQQDIFTEKQYNSMFVYE